jgi:2-dehydro-3-deoxyphosphogluconate aldolase/(4S)-4-hydroxy-2-oxoglutarate aldolase
LGAGTVLDPHDCQAAIDSGATFIVSPVTDLEVLAVAHRADVAYFGGAMTPGEIHRAMTSGVDLVKIFPVGAVGGAAYFKTLREPFPQLRSIVSGGIRAASFASYIDADAQGVCVGGG